MELVSPENAGYIGGTLFVGYSVAPVEGYGELANSYEFKHRDEGLIALVIATATTAIITVPIAAPTIAWGYML